MIDLRRLRLWQVIALATIGYEVVVLLIAAVNGHVVMHWTHR
jgi:hypothetical protein